MSSIIEKDKKDKSIKKEEEKGAVAITAPVSKKKKILEEADQEENLIKNDKVRLIRDKILNSSNECTIGSTDWEALYKLFQVLQISFKEDDSIDDEIRNIVQNMTDILNMDIKFTDNGKSEPVDFSDYEDEDISHSITPSVKISIDEEVQADLVVMVDTLERDYGASINRINSKLYKQLINLSDNRIDNVNKIDNYISLLVKFRYFDIEIKEEHLQEIDDIVLKLRDIQKKNTKDIKRFYKKKFDDVNYREDFGMARTERSERDRRPRILKDKDILERHMAKKKGGRRKEEAEENLAEDMLGKNATKLKGIERIKQLKERKKSLKDSDDEDDDDASSKRIAKAIKKLIKDAKSGLKKAGLLDEAKTLQELAEKDKISEKKLSKFIESLKDDEDFEEKYSRLLKKLTKLVDSDDEDDEDDERESKKKGKKSKKSKKSKDDDDDDEDDNDERKSRKKSKSKKKKSKKSKDDDDDDEDDNDERKSRKKSKSKKKKSKKSKDDDDDDEFTNGEEYLQIDSDDLSSIVDELLDEYRSELKSFSRNYLCDLKALQSQINDDAIDYNRAVSLLIVAHTVLDIEEELKEKIKETIFGEGDDEEMIKGKKKGKKNKKNTKGGNKEMKKVVKMVEELLEENKKALKEAKLKDSAEEIVEAYEEDELKAKDLKKFIKKAKKDEDLMDDAGKLIKKLSKALDSDDDDEDDDDDRKTKKSKKKSKRDEDKGDLNVKKVVKAMKVLIEEAKDELKDADLLKDAKSILSDAKEDELSEKDLKKFIKKAKKDEDLMDDHSKLIKALTKAVDSDDDDDDDDDRKSKKKGKKSKKSKKSKKIDWDEVEEELTKKDKKAIKELIDESDLSKKDSKSAKKMLENEEYEDLYDLASEEDEDLAEELKDIFRGCARVSNSGDCDKVLKAYFLDPDEENIDELEIVTTVEDIDDSKLDRNDMKDIDKEILDLYRDPECIEQDLPILVTASSKKFNNKENRDFLVS